MRVKRILVTTIPALLIWLVCPAGVAALELSGQVVDGQGNPLNGAGVRVIQIPYLGAITDADGKFSIDLEEEHLGEDVRIWIEKKGYRIWFRDIRIANGMGYQGTITLETPPAPPNLISPKDGATVLVPDPTFEWESMAGCTYNLQVDDHSSFLSPEIYEERLHASRYQSRIRLSDGTYHWRVQAEEDTGNYSAWSEPWMVRVRSLAAVQGARNRKAAFRSLLIPGWGQKYKGHSGWVWCPMTVAYGSSLAGALAFELIRHEEYDEYLKAKPVWELLDRFEKAEDAWKWRNGLIIAASVIAVSSAVHAYLSYDPRLERESQEDVGLGFNIQEDQIRLVFLKHF
jgi:hypothetical protein